MAGAVTPGAGASAAGASAPCAPAADFRSLGGQVQGRHETLGHGRHEIGDLAPGGGQVVPAAIDPSRERQRQQQDRTAGDAPLRHRLRHVQLGTRDATGGFLLEPAHDLFGIESDMLGIAAQKAGRVGGAGQVLEAAVLQRLEIGLADAQVERHVAQLVAMGLPRHAEIRTEGRSPVEVVDVSVRQVRSVQGGLGLVMPALALAHSASRSPIQATSIPEPAAPEIRRK
jgi:hypothetical protein